MTTQKSCFKIGRVLPFAKDTLCRYRGMTLFYTIMCLLFLPVQYGLSVYRYYEMYENSSWRIWYEALQNDLGGAAHIYNAFSVVCFSVLMLVMPLVLSVSLYGYMQNRRAVDVYHSLPLTRQELFFSRAIAAAVILWAPLILSFGITAGIAAFVPEMQLSLIGADLLFWMGGVFTLFVISSFVATQVGTTADHALFSIVLSVSLSGICVMMATLASNFLYGFQYRTEFFELVYRLCPESLMLGRFAISDSEYLLRSNVSAAVWFVLSCVLLVISAWLYRRRKSEQAEQLGTMGPLQIVVRAAGTLIAGICFAWVLAIVLSIETGVGMLICIGAGALLAYYIGDVILTHSVRRLRATLPAALATVAVVCIACGGVIFDYFGYETRVPAAENVESVVVDGAPFRYTSQTGYNNATSELVLTNPETIEAIVAMHRAQTGAENTSEENGSLTLTYHLKNGSTLRRTYLRLCEEAREQLSRLETNDEVLTKTAAVFRADSTLLTDVSVTNAFGTREEEVLLSPSQKSALLEALRADLLAQPQSELDNGAKEVAMLALTVAYPQEQAVNRGEEIKATYLYLLTESFSRTLAVLEDTNAADALENDIDEVDQIRICVGGDLYSQRNYYIGSGENDPWYIMDYTSLDSGDVENRVYLSCEITKEEYASLTNVSCYKKNLYKDINSMVTIAFCKNDTANGDFYPTAWEYTDLDSLPQALRTRVIAAYENYCMTDYPGK